MCNWKIILYQSILFHSYLYQLHTPTMDLSKRLVLVKSSAKEEDYPAYTTEDVIFSFEDIIHPEGLILNHSDPSE